MRFPWACLALAGRNASPALFCQKCQFLLPRTPVTEPAGDPLLDHDVHASPLRVQQPRGREKTRGHRRKVEVVRKKVTYVHSSRYLHYIGMEPFKVCEGTACLVCGISGMHHALTHPGVIMVTFSASVLSTRRHIQLVGVEQIECDVGELAVPHQTENKQSTVPSGVKGTTMYTNA